MKRTTYIIIGLVAASFAIEILGLSLLFATSRKKAQNEIDGFTRNYLSEVQQSLPLLGPFDKVRVVSGIGNRTLEIGNFSITRADSCSFTVTEGAQAMFDYLILDDNTLYITFKEDNDYFRCHIDSMAITMPQLQDVHFDLNAGIRSLAGFDQDSISIFTDNYIYFDDCRFDKAAVACGAYDINIGVTNAQIGTLYLDGGANMDLSTYDKGSVGIMYWNPSKDYPHTHYTTIEKANLGKLIWLGGDTKMELKTSKEVTIDFQQ